MRKGSAASISSSAAVSSSRRAMAMYSMAEWRSDTSGPRVPWNAPRTGRSPGPQTHMLRPPISDPAASRADLGSLGRCFPGAAHIFQPNHLVRLRSLGTLNDVKFHLVAFLQTFIAINLNGAVMHEDVCAAFTSEKAVAFRVIEPFDCSLILRQCRALLAVVWLDPIIGPVTVTTQNAGWMVFWVGCFFPMTQVICPSAERPGPKPRRFFPAPACILLEAQ